MQNNKPYKPKHLKRIRNTILIITLAFSAFLMLFSRGVAKPRTVSVSAEESFDFIYIQKAGNSNYNLTGSTSSGILRTWELTTWEIDGETYVLYGGNFEADKTTSATQTSTETITLNFTDHSASILNLLQGKTASDLVGDYEHFAINEGTAFQIRLTDYVVKNLSGESLYVAEGEDWALYATTPVKSLEVKQESLYMDASAWRVIIIPSEMECVILLALLFFCFSRRKTEKKYGRLLDQISALRESLLTESGAAGSEPTGSEPTGSEPTGKETLTVNWESVEKPENYGMAQMDKLEGKMFLRFMTLPVAAYFYLFLGLSLPTVLFFAILFMMILLWYVLILTGAVRLGTKWRKYPIPLDYKQEFLRLSCFALPCYRKHLGLLKFPLGGMNTYGTLVHCLIKLKRYGETHELLETAYSVCPKSFTGDVLYFNQNFWLSYHEENLQGAAYFLECMERTIANYTKHPKLKNAYGQVLALNKAIYSENWEEVLRLSKERLEKNPANGKPMKKQELKDRSIIVVGETYALAAYYLGQVEIYEEYKEKLDVLCPDQGRSLREKVGEM